MGRFEMSRRGLGAASMALAAKYCPLGTQVSLLRANTGDSCLVLVPRKGGLDANDLVDLMRKALPPSRSQQPIYKEIFSWFVKKWPGRTFIAYLDGRTTGQFSIVQGLNAWEQARGTPKRAWDFRNQVKVALAAELPAEWANGFEGTDIQVEPVSAFGGFEEIKHWTSKLKFKTSADAKSAGKRPTFLHYHRERKVISSDGCCIPQPTSPLLFRSEPWADQVALKAGRLPTIPDAIEGRIDEPHFILGSIDPSGSHVKELFFTMAHDGQTRCLSLSRPLLGMFRFQHPLVSKMLSDSGELRDQDWQPALID